MTFKPVMNMIMLDAPIEMDWQEILYRSTHFFLFYYYYNNQSMSSLEDLFGKLAVTTVTTVSRIALSHATNAAIVSCLISSS